MTASENRRYEILESLYYAQQESSPVSSRMSPIGGYLARKFPDDETQDRWLRTLDDLRRDGLVVLSESFRGLAGISAMLTEDGRGVVEEVHARWDAEEEGRRRKAADPALRRPAAVNGLLRWLYEANPDGVGWTEVQGFLGSPLSQFVGVRLSRGEVDRAAKYLKDNGLIDGPLVAEFQGPVNAQITAAGQECVEQGGTVSEFLSRERGTTPSIHIGTVNNSNLAFNSEKFTQSVVEKTDPAALAGFVQMMLREVSALQMGAEREAAVREALAEVLRAVEQPHQDRGRVAGAFGRVVKYLSDAGQPVLTAAFMLAASHYGLPTS